MRRVLPLIAALLLAACGGGDGGVELTGNEIALGVSVGEWGEIWLMAPDGSNRRRLTDPRPAGTDASGASSPAWSPDGSKLVYAAQTDAPASGRSTSELYVMNADGTDRERLTTNEDFEGDPVWSPDGQRIAFARVTGIGTGGVRSGIAVMDAEGGAARLITRAPAGGFDGTPAWSPDGSLIAFTRAILPRGSEGAKLDLFTVAPAGTGLEKLAAGGGDPSWSPDGTRIAYSSIRDRFGRTCIETCTTSGEIYVAEADGTRQRRLTHTRADDGSPAWSPDGRRLAFASDRAERNDETEIFLMNADGRDVLRITRNLVWDLEPAWRPR